MSGRAALFVSACGIGCAIFANSRISNSKEATIMKGVDNGPSASGDVKSMYPSYTHYGKNKQRQMKAQASSFWSS